MTKLILIVFVALNSAISFAKAPSQKTIILETMEIPPFMSAAMPYEGAATYATREMLKKAGYNLEVRFVPIMRIRNLKFSKPDVNGFFPSFVDDDFVEGLTLTKTVYETPWVIIERKDHPIKWKEPKDLAAYKGGNVNGYTIRSQIRKIYEENKLNIETAPDDALNILKLANKRVDYIFTDAHIFKFLMATDPRLKPFANDLQINKKIVVMNRYGLAIKNDAYGKKFIEDFNKVADPQEFEKSVMNYFKLLNQAPEQQPPGANPAPAPASPSAATAGTTAPASPAN